MASWEVCYIQRERSKIKGKECFWWEAYQAVPQGRVLIDKSELFFDPAEEEGVINGFFGFMRIGVRSFFDLTEDSKNQRIFEERNANAYASLIARLAEAGWEPISQIQMRRSLE